jgi:hypothetical protein
MPKSNKKIKDASVSTNANTLFKPNQNENKVQHCTQNINLTIQIDQKEDAITGCFKAIAGIFRRRP